MQIFNTAGLRKPNSKIFSAKSVVTPRVKPFAETLSTCRILRVRLFLMARQIKEFLAAKNAAESEQPVQCLGATAC